MKERSSGQEPDLQRVDPVALGRHVGNIVNGLPDFPSAEDLQVAEDVSRLRLLEQMEAFDEVVCPDEVEWGVPNVSGDRDPSDPFVDNRQQRPRPSAYEGEV